MPCACIDQASKHQVPGRKRGGKDEIMLGQQLQMCEGEML